MKPFPRSLGLLNAINQKKYEIYCLGQETSGKKGRWGGWEVISLSIIKMYAFGRIKLFYVHADAQISLGFAQVLTKYKWKNLL